MLKGKRVLTRDYFGVVLNDAEHEQAVIIALTRVRREHHYEGSPYCPTSTSVWWVVADHSVIVPWSDVGTLVIHQKMPKWLYLRSLRKRR